MKLIPFKKAFSVVRNAMKQNAPLLYIAVAGVGTVCTVGFTIRATKKAEKIVQKMKDESGEEHIPTSQIIKATWPCYIPVVASVAVTASGMILSVKESSRREGSLAAALAVTETAKSVYRDEVKKIGGDDAIAKADATVQQAIKPMIFSSDPLINDTFAIFEDGLTNARYYARHSDVVAAFEWADKEMNAGEDVTLDAIWGRIGVQIPSCWASENLCFNKVSDFQQYEFKPQWEPRLTDDFKSYIRVCYPWSPQIL